jgi:hypothetical protein
LSRAPTAAAEAVGLAAFGACDSLLPRRAARAASPGGSSPSAGSSGAPADFLLAQAEDRREAAEDLVTCFAAAAVSDPSFAGRLLAAVRHGGQGSPVAARVVAVVPPLVECIDDMDF